MLSPNASTVKTGDRKRSSHDRRSKSIGADTLHGDYYNTLFIEAYL